jgi:hypothetical protein
MLGTNCFEMASQVGLDPSRHHGSTIACTFAGANDDFVALEIEILDAQSAAFEEAQSRAVQESRHERRSPAHPLQDRADLLSREDDWDVMRALRPDDVFEPRQLEPENFPI